MDIHRFFLAARTTSGEIYQSVAEAAVLQIAATSLNQKRVARIGDLAADVAVATLFESELAYEEVGRLKSGGSAFFLLVVAEQPSFVVGEVEGGDEIGYYHPS